MMNSLRPYQASDVEACFRLWDSGATGTLTRLATGMGKTRSSIAKMQRWLASGVRRRCMILIHETQLADYWAEQIAKHLGITPGIEMAERRSSPHDRVVIASRSTLLKKSDGSSRLHKFDPVLDWLVIYDECDRYAHRQASTGHIVDWFEQNPASKRSGITGTPNRYDRVSILDKMFPAIATDIPMPAAIEQGWSVPIRQAFVQVTGMELDDMPPGQDARDEQMARQLANRVATCAQPTLDLAGSRRTIMFSPRRDVAHAVADWMNRDRRIRCVAVDGTIKPAARKAIYAAYGRGEFQFLSCCGLCTRGFDDPETSCVAVFRSFSKDAGALAEQIKGRGTRVLPGVVDGLHSAEERRAAIAASNKPDMLVIDLMGDSGIGRSHSTLDLLYNGLPDELVWRLVQYLNGRGELLDTAVTEAKKQFRPSWFAELSPGARGLLETLMTRVGYYVLPDVPPWKLPGAGTRYQYETRLFNTRESIHPSRAFVYIPKRSPMWRFLA